MKRILLFIVFILLPGAESLLAQSGGKIVGQVFDAETGEVLVGCNILVKGTSLGAATDKDGYFYVLNVPPGIYDVSAVMIGYAEDVRQGVKIVSNLTVRLEFRPRPELLVGEAITVEAFRNPLVQKDLTYKIQAVTSDEISRIPITTINDLLVQQAGITRQINTSPISSLPVFGQFATIPTDGLHFRGGRENETLYLFDGINVSDALWGGYSIDPIGEFTISSLETFSGTFEPRYGDAMSGVVNIASYDKIDITPRFKVKMFTDNHGIDAASQNTNSGEVFLSGTLPSVKNVGFIVSHRSYSTDGYINGYIYPEYVNSEGTDKSGKPKIVPMQYSDTQFSFGKMIWNINEVLSFSLGGYYAKANRGVYNHYFKYNPYGTPRVNLEDNLLYAKLKYILNNSTYLSLSAANYNRNFRSRVFDNAAYYDIRPQNGTAEFSISGEDWVYFNTHFNRGEVSADIFTQLDKIHSLGAGITYDQLRTKLARKNPDGFGVLEDYDYKPVEISGYLSDKMEFDDMGLIVNLGLRFDYIDPARDVLLDLRSVSDLEAPLEKADKILYVTPRIGLSFPILEKAAVRFGYGHYYQYPDYFKIYQGTFYLDSKNVYRPNPQLENTPLSDRQVKPEKTINYEVGIQTRISDDIAFDISAFYRKTSNLIGVSLNKTQTQEIISVLGNVDYATVKGLEFSLKKHFTKNFSAFLNYTLSKTLVSTSILFERATDEARTFPANWDQPHFFSGNLYFEFDNGFGFAVYGSASSGFPYTPASGGRFNPNSERSPWIHSLDLNLFKKFKYLGMNQELFIQILNVPNRRNVWWVYGDSGIAGDDANPATSHDYTNNPAMYGPGRVIQIGFKLWN